MNVNDMEIAKSLFNPKRIRIIRLVDDTSMTVKEMADALNEKPSRLYYHIHKLVEQGLLEATDAKQVGHLTETYYQAVKDMESFNIENKFAKENSDYVIKQLLMRVNKNMEVLKADFDKEEPEAYRSQANLLQADLSWKEWQTLNAEIRALVDKRGREAKSNKDEEKLSINYVLMSYADEEEK